MWRAILQAIGRVLCGLFGHDINMESDTGAPLVFHCDRCGWRHPNEGE